MFIVSLVTDDGAAFCHSVCQSVGEVYLLHKLLHFGIEGGTANDDFNEVSAKHFDSLLAYVSLGMVVDKGKVHHQFAQLGVDAWKNVLLENLLHHQGDARDDAWLDFGKRFGNDFG